MRDGTGRLDQPGGIHVKVFAAMEVTQESDTAEQIADKVFKRQVTRPLSSEFDTGGCEKFEFNHISDGGRAIHHIGETENQAFIGQHLGRCCVNRLAPVAVPCGEAFHLVKLAPPTLVSKTDAPLTYLIEGEHHPRQQVNRLTDENQIAGEGIPRRIFQFLSTWRFKHKRVRGERLASEEGTIIGYWGFKAFGVNALLRELALLLALPRTPDAGDAPQDIPQPAAEDVAFVFWHLQRLLDGVGESVSCESEVLEHHGSGAINLCCSLKVATLISAISCAFSNRSLTVALNALNSLLTIMHIPWA